MIYDQDTKKWYEICRGWRKRLIMREVIYEKIIKFPTESDFVFSGSKELKQWHCLPEPKTPEP